jgi:hypothetical protein
MRRDGTSSGEATGRLISRRTRARQFQREMEAAGGISHWNAGFFEAATNERE